MLILQDLRVGWGGLQAARCAPYIQAGTILQNYQESKEKMRATEAGRLVVSDAEVGGEPHGLKPFSRNAGTARRFEAQRKLKSCPPEEEQGRGDASKLGGRRLKAALRKNGSEDPPLQSEKKNPHPQNRPSRMRVKGWGQERCPPQKAAATRKLPASLGGLGLGGLGLEA